MNRKELIAHTAGRTGQSRDATKQTLDALLDVIGETAALGQKVTLPGFGTFEGKDVAARQMRNPATGEPLFKPATRTAKFKAGNALKAKVAGQTPIKTGQGA